MWFEVIKTRQPADAFALAFIIQDNKNESAINQNKPLQLDAFMV